MEDWYDKKPSLRYLRVFGCEAYAYVPDRKRSKVENKVVKCICISYGIGVKGYKLWNHVTKTFIYNRSVIFRDLKPSSVDLQLETMN